MPVYKTVTKSIPPSAQRLLSAATKALLRRDGTAASGSLKGVPGCAVGSDNVPGKHQMLQAAIAKCQSVAGSRPIGGWCLEQLRRKGVDKFVVMFEHHVVIEMPGGHLLCPSTPVGQEIQFLRDDSSPFNEVLGYNRAIYSSVSIKGSRGVAPAYTLAWATNWGSDQAYSTDPRHARWAAWNACDPVQRAISAGLKGDNVLDVVMTSDLDELCLAIAVKPHPSLLKDASSVVLIEQLRKLEGQGAFRTPTSAQEIATPATEAAAEAA